MRWTDLAACPQITKNAYDFEANLAILKLYQFYPEKCNMDFVAKILAKALMNLPETDFLLSTYLISEQVKMDKCVKSLCELANLLERCEFKAFWASVTTCPAAAVLQGIPDFNEKVSEFISGLIAISHQSIEIKVLSQLLHQTPEATASHIKGKGWKSDATTVTFPLNDGNQAKIASVASERLQFGQLKNLLSTLT